MKSMLLVLLLSAGAYAETIFVKIKPEALQIESFLSMRKAAKATALNGMLLIIEGKKEDYLNKPGVEYVSVNHKVHALGYKTSVTDPKAWGITKTQVDKLWAKGFKGKGITVAVVDTGVDSSHPELTGRVLPGFNAIDGSTNSMDDMGHGTHCSGTIGGLNVGMAPEATILPAKFLDANGSGDLEGAIKALEWVTKQNPQIISNSWGGGGFNQALADVIKAAQDKGIIVVAAAGNETNDNDKTASYPANYKNVISVAAIDIDDKLASFSNFGAKTVCIGAPGVDIYSSLPGGKYEAWSGTSMATPHVAGVLALLKQQGCKNPLVCLKKNSKAIVSLSKKVLTKSKLQVK